MDEKYLQKALYICTEAAMYICEACDNAKTHPERWEATDAIDLSHDLGRVIWNVLMDLRTDDVVDYNTNVAEWYRDGERKFKEMEEKARQRYWKQDGAE